MYHEGRYLVLVILLVQRVKLDEDYHTRLLKYYYHERSNASLITVTASEGIAEGNSQINTLNVCITTDSSFLLPLQQTFVAQLFHSYWEWLRLWESPVCMCLTPP